MKRALRLSLLCLLPFGCRCEEPLGTVPDPEIQIDVFSQKAAAQVDILWVMDNSDSMLAEQFKVAGRFNQFFNQLLTSQVDYHIGVVTTDPDEDGGTLRAYDGPSVDGCDSCRFLTKDVSCPNPEVDITGLSDAQIDATLADECPASLVFRKLVAVGVGGTSFEQGFVAAATALGVNDIDPDTGVPLGNIPEANAGFLRPEAALYIVFVSDEDEGAKNDGSPVRYYQRLFEGMKGAGNENKVAVAAITGYSFDDALPPLADVCAILETTFDRNSANDDSRAAGLQSAMRDQQNGCYDELGDPDDGDSFAELGGRYIELACRTGGVIANMCESDYSTALDALGANAAGLLRKFSLSLPTRFNTGPDCTPFTDDDLVIDCDDDGATDGALDGPICVKARTIGEAEGDERLVPRDDAAGWRYETSTSSVRFDGSFLPAPGSEVEIRYRVYTTADKSPCGG